MTGRISIGRAAASKPGEDGILSEGLLISERRSKKVGALPEKARMVLAAVRRCLPDDADASAGAGGPVGVSLGTFYGSMDVAEQCLQAVQNGGFQDVTPSWYATGLPNATAAIVASVHGLTGPNLTALGYQAGIEAIVMGCRQIRAGRAAAMLAGGFDLVGGARAAQLSQAPEYAEASAIHPGVGLVWLAPEREPGTAATVAGWSQGTIAEGETERDFVARLVRSACAEETGRHTTVHLVRPGRAGSVDYLAATAPIHLVESIVEAGSPGLHALVVRGFGPSALCLAVALRDR